MIRLVDSTHFYFATGFKKDQVLRVPSSLRRLSLVDQIAAHLRESFQSGRLVGQLPGVEQLMEELVVSKRIVRSALKVLEEEGLIENCGAGRRRKIVAERNNKPIRRSFRIGIMLYKPLEDEEANSIRVLLGIRRAIESAGHVCVFSDRDLTHLNDNLTRISRYVKTVNADAWIVISGSRIVLEWFAAQAYPVYAYGGRFQNFPVACSSTTVASAIESVVNTLLNLNHRRIVMLVPTVLRKPSPVPSFEKYLSLLEARGIAVTDFHLPHFEETIEGLENCLDALFRITPPTALLLESANYYTAACSFLTRRGLRVPRDVSVICMKMDPALKFCVPAVDCFSRPVNRHVANIARWVDGVVNGRADKRQEVFEAVYVPGGTVGPAKL